MTATTTRRATWHELADRLGPQRAAYQFPGPENLVRLGADCEDCRRLTATTVRDGRPLCGYCAREATDGDD